MSDVRTSRSRAARPPGPLVFVALTAALFLASCAGRSDGVLTPVGDFAEPPGASRVDMLVATMRRPTPGEPSRMFGGDRAREMRFADIAVSIPPDSARVIGDVQWPANPPGDPSRDFVTVRAEELDAKGAQAHLDQRLAHTPGRRVLLFVHGYNTRFDDAVYRFAQIAHDSRAAALPLLFTWPSRGRLLAYTYDRESATYSRDALEAVLQTLVKDKAVAEIDVLAHSMGNWAAIEALHQMAVRDGRIAPKIKEIVLAAPDVDFDVFLAQVSGMGSKRPPITMFVSRDDKALALSARLWGDKRRAGAIDPNAEPYKSELAALNVKTIDLSDVKSDDPLNHSKFAQSPEIVRLIGQRLANGQTLTESRSGIGERIGVAAVGAASTVGGAAGVVVSAPLAIVDPQTRETLGERASDIGDGIGDTLRSTADVVHIGR
ncbi:MAG: alpha/beta hydrolase [Hyphomicrobiales bacterium]|nr:alpha/beta hydrolase [Hyphomicrobiales bacterium]